LAALAQQHDCLLVDLDGTVFRGSQPTPDAVAVLASMPGRTFFITNNASRGAAQVAAHLRELGFTASADDVVTSAQAAARLLAAELPADSRVLVIGTDSLADEVAAVGLRPVRQWRDRPVAVVQGHSTDTGWADLAQGALAIRSGALWVAANVDYTLPSEQGLLPGNGAMVAALRATTDSEPRVAGKPSPELMTQALSRGDFAAPLVIGDRLDTDIAGADAADLPSLMVLTGANSPRDAVYAPVGLRPSYIGEDLRALRRDAEMLAVAPQPAWRVEVSGATVTVTTGADDDGGDGLSIVRAVGSAVWNADLGAHRAVIAAGDEGAHAALRRWSLV
jgi:HAD superfamily hydrolase (TIGR01450 family)